MNYKKRTISLFVSICLMISMIIVVEAEKYNNISYTYNNGVVHLTGTIASEKSNTGVVLQVLKPGVKPNEITIMNILEKVEYDDQVYTDSNGNFVFDFSISDPLAEYPVYIRVADENEPIKFVVCGQSLIADFNMENIGHIYYDPSEIPIRFDVKSYQDATSVVVDMTISDSTAMHSEVIKKQIVINIDTENKGICDYTLDLSEEEFSYGVFNIKFDFTDNFGNNVIKETEFTVVNSLQNEILNNHMGTVFGFHKNDWGTYHTEESIGDFMEIIKGAGIGNGRHGVYWRDYETGAVVNSDGTVTSGTYELEEITDTIISKMTENEISPLYILYMTHGEYKELYNGSNADSTIGSVVQSEELKKYNAESIGDISSHLKDYVLNEISKKTGYVNPLGGFDTLVPNVTKLDYMPTTEKAINGFGKFAGEFAEDTQDVEYYEIWNEPNIKSFNVQGATPEHYAKMLKSAYVDIHNKKPDGKVVGMAVAFDYSDTLEVNNKTMPRAYWWMREVLENLGTEEKYMDAVSIHIYEGASLPEAGKKSIWAEQIRELFKEYGYDNIELLMTETGYSTGTEAAIEKSPLRQALFAVRDYAIHGMNFDKWYWYSAVETTTGDAYEDGLGMLKSFKDSENPYGAKPLYAAISNHNSLLAEAELIEAKGGDLSVPYTYIYQDINGDKVYMLWRGGSAYKDGFTKTDYTINIGANNITVYDLFGNQTEESSVNGSYTLPVGGAPIYIKVKDCVNFKFSRADNEKRIIKLDENITDIKATVTINQDLWEYDDAVIVVAKYSEGRLNKCVMSNVIDENNYEYILNTSDSDTVKIFVWDGIDTLIPIRNIVLK